MDIPLLVGSASRKLRRLEATGRAELASVANIERMADEDRHQRWAVGVGFVSAVAIPLSLILAFFSAELAELESARSMFGPEYLWLHGAIGILILIAVGIGIATFLAQPKSDE